MASAKTERLGPYAIERRIAVGGMAEVFAASAADAAAHSTAHPTAERADPLVVKILLPQLAHDAATLAAFVHEGRVGRVLRHEGIAQVVDAGVSRRDGADAHYIVIERVDGVLVSDLLATGKALSFGAVASLLVDLLGALAFAHGALDEAGRPMGLVHRDVSPRNVFATRAGRAMLADFGIARSSLREDRTRTGAIRGTLGYLSPEQVTGSEVDPRSDVFAAGVLAWELSTAEPFLAASGELERLRASEAPPFRRPSIAGADPRLDALLERALRRFPEERHPSARAFRDEILAQSTAAERDAGRRELSRCVAEIAGAPERAELVTGPPSARSEPSRRRSMPWVLGGVALLATSVFVLRGNPTGAPGQASSDPSNIEAAQEAPSLDARPIARPPASAWSMVHSSATALPGVPASSTLPTSASTASDARSAAPPASRAPVAGSPARPVPSSSPAPASTGSAASSASTPAAPPPSPSQWPSTAPSATPKRDVRKELDATNAVLRAARSRGEDTRAADARAAIALEAILDGRDADAERELAAIRSMLAK